MAAEPKRRSTVMLEEVGVESATSSGQSVSGPGPAVPPPPAAETAAAANGGGPRVYHHAVRGGG